MVSTKKTIRKTTPIAEDYLEPEVKPQKPLVSKALPFVYVALIVMAFGIGVLWQKVQSLEKSANSVQNTTTTQTAQATPAPVTIDQIKNLFGQEIIKFGDANKKLLIVAVEDPSCPYCHAANGKDSELNGQFGPQFKLVKDGGAYVAPMDEIRKLVDSGQASLAYIYMPGHGNGEMGQKALYCAFEKGKFWQAHDLIYNNGGYNLQNTTVLNDKTKSQIVANFLKSVVNPADMKTCLDSGKYDARLQSDTALAGSLGVTGTPGFFINTTRFAGAYSFSDMKSAVDSALK